MSVIHVASSTGSFCFRESSYYANELAKSLNCNSGSTADKLACLQVIDVETIMSRTLMFNDNCTFRLDLARVNECAVFPQPWVPAKDNYAKLSMMPESPIKLLSAHKVANVPIMIGFNEDEGLIASSRLAYDNSYKLYFFEHFDRCGPINLFAVDPSQITETMVAESNKLLESYFLQPDHSPKERFRHFTNLIGDAVFIRSAHHTSECLRNSQIPVYRYMSLCIFTPSVLFFVSLHIASEAYKSLIFF